MTVAVAVAVWVALMSVTVVANATSLLRLLQSVDGVGVGHANAVPPIVAGTDAAVVGTAVKFSVDEQAPPAAVPFTVAVAVAPAASDAMVQVAPVTEPVVADTVGAVTHGRVKPVMTMS